MKKSVVKTVPVMAGYLFLGSAFGILVESQGLPVWVALLMSVFIYAGSMQFATVPLLLNPISLLQTFILTLSINARHLFYGVSMLKIFEKMGLKKQYMIFSLTDESYSLIINEDDGDQMFNILLLNQIYWIIGTAMGYYFGRMIPFSKDGIEFAMTALFLIIFMEKLKDKQLYPTFLGLGVSTLCLIIFKPQYFIIPSMIGIVLGLQRRNLRD
ncbi:MAG TPA: AzlC family ABC transporter permease [Erysipelothrix sp.]|nr:AzlC family ABC transporter permease [Erysipelothrix sp.]